MDALRWLQQRQKKSGCFQSMGKLFNNALQVGQGWGGDPECGLGSGGVTVLVSQPSQTCVPLPPCRAVSRMSSHSRRM